METGLIESRGELRSIRWVGGVDGHLEILDQTLLPGEVRYLACRDVATLSEAIRMLRVRGAPLIGIAAAYGVCLALRGNPPRTTWRESARQAADQLGATRPTAVNLFWALQRMRQVLAESAADEPGGVPDPALRERLIQEAQQIQQQDREICHAIGRVGAALLPDPCCVLTHCNTGGLATSEYGTALSVIFTAQDQGKRLQVFVDETRPLLQGARLTAWELQQRGVPMALICDSMAAQVMREGRVQIVLTGADRIVANGDAANKIGTYGLALWARAHGIPFYIAAPISTFDLSLNSGNQIQIEQRSAEEIIHCFGRQIAPTGTAVYNPAFDVTPAEYITGIITERGVIQPVNATSVAAMHASRDSAPGCPSV